MEATVAPTQVLGVPWRRSWCGLRLVMKSSAASKRSSSACMAPHHPIQGLGQRVDSQEAGVPQAFAHPVVSARAPRSVIARASRTAIVRALRTAASTQRFLAPCRAHAQSLDWQRSLHRRERMAEATQGRTTSSIRRRETMGEATQGRTMSNTRRRAMMAGKTMSSIRRLFPQQHRRTTTATRTRVGRRIRTITRKILQSHLEGLLNRRMTMKRRRRRRRRKRRRRRTKLLLPVKRPRLVTPSRSPMRTTTTIPCSRRIRIESDLEKDRRSESSPQALSMSIVAISMNM
mmetsp:Transcript_65652/g.145276  ORF Transcript_65652/g.145276 Transcript_65652/m.145276 type:complete len:289 (+) Transcript_65652:766-1632(+)